MDSRVSEAVELIKKAESTVSETADRTENAGILELRLAANENLQSALVKVQSACGMDCDDHNRKVKWSKWHGDTLMSQGEMTLSETYKTMNVYEQRAYDSLSDSDNRNAVYGQIIYDRDGNPAVYRFFADRFAEDSELREAYHKLEGVQIFALRR